MPRLPSITRKDQVPTKDHGIFDQIVASRLIPKRWMVRVNVQIRKRHLTIGVINRLGVIDRRKRFRVKPGAVLIVVKHCAPMRRPPKEPLTFAYAIVPVIYEHKAKRFSPAA